MLRLGLTDWPAAIPWAWPIQQGLTTWPGSVRVAPSPDIDTGMVARTLGVGLVSPATFLQHQAAWLRSRPPLAA